MLHFSSFIPLLSNAHNIVLNFMLCSSSFAVVAESSDDSTLTVCSSFLSFAFICVALFRLSLFRVLVILPNGYLVITSYSTFISSSIPRQVP